MTEATNQEQTAPTISLQDLENAIKVIDAACQRGSFRGDEMSSVGGVRDKLFAFLASATPAPAAEEQTEEATAEAPKAKKAARAKA